MRRENLAVERLERRELLAGSLTAKLVGSDLQISGDDLDNIARIERGGRNVIRVVPDATTSVNGLRPGEPDELRGSARNVDVQLGAGNDSLSFDASPLYPRMMKIDTGEGSDQIQLLKMRVLGDVSVVNPADFDTVEVVDSLVLGVLAVKHGESGFDPPRGLARRADLARTSIQHSTIGSIQSEVHSLPNELEIADSRVVNTVDHKHHGWIELSSFSLHGSRTGKVTVESEGTPTDVKIDDDSSLAAIFVKIKGLRGDVTTEPAEFELNDSDVRGEVSYDHKAWNDLIPVRFSTNEARIAGPVSVHSEGASLDMKMEDTRAASVDGYVKIGSIKGESLGRAASNFELINSHIPGTVDHKHEGWTDISSFSMHGSRTGKVTVESDGTPTDIKIDDDSSLAAIFVKIKGLKGDVTTEPAEFELNDSDVRGEVSYDHKAWNDLVAVRFSTNEARIAGPVSVHSEGVPLDMKMESTRAASVDAFVKIDPIQGESLERGASSFELVNSHVPGRVDHMHAGWIELSSVSLHGSRTGKVSVESEGTPTDVKIQNSSVAAFDAFYKIDTIPGEASDGISQFEFHNVVIRGGFRVSSDIALQGSVTGSVVRGATDINMGAGEDLLAIRDSFFAQSVLLDGGDDDDVLELESNTFRVDPILLNWEVIVRPPR